MTSPCRNVFFLVVWLLAATPVYAAEPVITYEDHVAPILRRHCFKCHGNDQQKADLNLQTAVTVRIRSSGGLLPACRGHGRQAD